MQLCHFSVWRFGAETHPETMLSFYCFTATLCVCLQNRVFPFSVCDIQTFAPFLLFISYRTLCHAGIYVADAANTTRPTHCGLVNWTVLYCLVETKLVIERDVFVLSVGGRFSCDQSNVAVVSDKLIPTQSTQTRLVVCTGMLTMSLNDTNPVATAALFVFHWEYWFFFLFSIVFVQ